MRADSKPQPPSQRRGADKRPAGRPRYYTIGDLMEVWLAVEEYRSRHNCSVNKACQQIALTFRVLGPGGIVPDYAVTKETLRSLYQAAVRALKAERKERDDLIRSMRDTGASSPQEHAPLHLAAFWQEQLTYRLQSS